MISYVKHKLHQVFSLFWRNKGNWTMWLAAGTLWTAAMGFLAYELVTALLDPPSDPFSYIRSVLLVVAAWIGLPFLIWRTRIADHQSNTERDSHYTDVLTTSIELLGSTTQKEVGVIEPAADTRVGAVYALERLAKQSKADYGRVLEILSAYVREQCGEAKRFTYEGDSPEHVCVNDSDRLRRVVGYCRALRDWHNELRKNAPANRADVATALAVIARRSEDRLWRGSKSSEKQPKLNNINLQGAGNSELARTLVRSGEDIELSSASLEASDLSFIQLDDDHPFVSAVMTLLPSQGPMVGPRSLSGSNLTSASFQITKFFPIVEGADLSFADMQGTKCRSGRFRSAVLSSTNFTGVDARDAQFGLVYGRGAIFNFADLGNAEFNGALLQDSRFYGAYLGGACFDGADLEGAALTGAFVGSADLTGAKNLTTEVLQQAFGTVDTLIPTGLERPAVWVDGDTVMEGWLNFRKHHGRPFREEEAPTVSSVVRADIIVPPGEWY